MNELKDLKETFEIDKISKPLKELISSKSSIFLIVPE